MYPSAPMTQEKESGDALLRAEMRASLRLALFGCALYTTSYAAERGASGMTHYLLCEDMLEGGRPVLAVASPSREGFTRRMYSVPPGQYERLKFLMRVMRGDPEAVAEMSNPHLAGEVCGASLLDLVEPL